MNGPRNEFLASACFSKQEHRGTTGSNRIHQVQNLAQRRTLANDPFEIHLAADFLFEIQLLLCELVSEFSDLAIG